jgi:hypothetical protein
MSGDNTFIGRDSVCGSGSGHAKYEDDGQYVRGTADGMDRFVGGMWGTGWCGGCTTREHYEGDGGYSSASNLDFRFVRNAVLGGSKYWRS